MADRRLAARSLECRQDLFDIATLVDDGSEHAGSLSLSVVERAGVEDDIADRSEPQKLVRQIRAASVRQVQIEDSNLKTCAGRTGRPARLRQADDVTVAQQPSGNRPSDDRVILDNQRARGLGQRHQKHLVA
jgi:hypothetical protein